jgi:hypothetical protein
MPTDRFQVSCAHCLRELEYSGERPKFCSSCGRPLAEAAPAATGAYASEAVTTPPAYDPEAATVAPASPRAADDGVPQVVGGYRLLRRLGGGGMGSVYEAEDPASGRRVALKLVLPEYAQSPEAVERFRQEGRLASSLAHPRCVFVLAADDDAGRPYIAMELMPGSTLDDLVKEKGPLPPEQALPKILDVIDGLHEAHQLGLVHRDVKPSNCFLEADGRVKVGDFGLAKSLVSDSKLTKTGTFLGTPLFAAPEQIKQEAVDAQSDVYSVAATLYFLLTGRAPFQSGDSLATLARIVSDDPPPMRGLRPELPRALDRAVLRGLERDRRKRYRNLDEFRKALLLFLPAQPSIGGMGLRFGAYLVDLGIVFALCQVAAQVVAWGVLVPLYWAKLLAPLSPAAAMVVAGYLTGAVVSFSYYGFLEGLWGWTPGKRLLRLRVGTATGNRPPGVARALLRKGVLFALFQLEQMVSSCLVVTYIPLDGKTPTPQQGLLMALVGLFNMAWLAGAAGLMLSTMRARNGYRGLHEFASGTRTYLLRWPQLRKRQAVARRDFRLAVTQPEGLPERVGAFRVQGALRWTEPERTLLAEDPQLGRQVWIRLRPGTEAPLDAARRDVSRSTRIRWVGCGKQADWQWDAFLAPAGMPLPALADGGRLSWAETRPVLEDLAEELAASCADGTLPHCLTVHQVWVGPSGRTQLLGTPLTGQGTDVAGAAPASEPEEEAELDDQQRALRFLRAVVVTALEGGPRPAAKPAGPVRAPVPVHAARLLDRLLGVGKPYATVGQLQQDLEATRDRPTQVSRLRRAGHLALMALLLHIPFMGPSLLFVLSFAALGHLSQRSGPGGPPDAEAAVYGFAGFCTVFWVVWAFLFRGGYAFWRGGIALRRADGRKASRVQCGFRALLVWAPIAGLLCLAAGVARLHPGLPWLYFGIWGAAVALPVVYVGLALWSPTRALHDRLAGTYLVPA